MGRIGDIADLVTGLALLGGGYLIYRAVKDVGDIIPEWPTFELPEWPTFEWPTFELPEWPTFEWPMFELPDWTLPDVPGFGGDEGIGGGGGGIRNGDTNGYIAPPYVPSPPPVEIPADYLDAILRGGGGGAYYYRDNGLTSTGTKKASSRRLGGGGRGGGYLLR